MIDNRKIYGSNNCGGYDDFELRRERVKTNKIIITTLIIFISYLIFIFMGYSSTTYTILEDGTKAALVVNLDARAGQEDYEKLKGYYNAINILMNECYEMEENIKTGKYDSFTYATNYAETLTKIDNYMAGVTVSTVDEKYSSVKGDINSCFNDFAIYCQKMNSALVNDSYDEYLVAETWLTTLENSYFELSKTFVDFGHNIQVYNDPDLKWYEEKLATMNNMQVDENPLIEEVEGDITNWEENTIRNGSSINEDNVEEEATEENKEDEIVGTILDGMNENSNESSSNQGYGNPISE